MPVCRVTLNKLIWELFSQTIININPLITKQKMMYLIYELSVIFGAKTTQKRGRAHE